MIPDEVRCQMLGETSAMVAHPSDLVRHPVFKARAMCFAPVVEAEPISTDPVTGGRMSFHGTTKNESQRWQYFT